MAENEDPADAATRLEAALERIARHAHRSSSHLSPPESADADTARLSVRLDALIARLRAALATQGH